MKLVAAIVLLVIGHLGLGTAYADSDGYYCIGRGYLAYQFGLAAPPTRPHRLTVIRLATSRASSRRPSSSCPSRGVLCPGCIGEIEATLAASKQTER